MLSQFEKYAKNSVKILPPFSCFVNPTHKFCLKLIPTLSAFLDSIASLVIHHLVPFYYFLTAVLTYDLSNTLVFNFILMSTT